MPCPRWRARNSDARATQGDGRRPSTEGTGNGRYDNRRARLRHLGAAPGRRPSGPPIAGPVGACRRSSRSCGASRVLDGVVRYHGHIVAERSPALAALDPPRRNQAPLGVESRAHAAPVLGHAWQCAISTGRSHGRPMTTAWHTFSVPHDRHRWRRKRSGSDRWGRRPVMSTRPRSPGLSLRRNRRRLASCDT
jgi:hypothetical protein